jgi:peptide/nickel transport system substrate-binding protein
MAYDLQQDLRAVGVLMRIQTAPWGECLKRIESLDFDAYAGHVSVGPHPDGGRARWRTDGSKNYSGYSNPIVDDLYDRARLTLDGAQQLIYYRRIQKLIYEDQPYAFLWHTPTLLAVSDRLRGVRVSPLGVSGFSPGPRAWWVPVQSP